VAACKLVALNEQSTDKERKTIEKEMRIHSALKHKNVLEFLNAVVVEMKHKHLYVPGIYMLLELAAGGDLFDKIGRYLNKYVHVIVLKPGLLQAPDVGVGDEIAHYYFNQLLAGMVRSSYLNSFNYLRDHRTTFTIKACAIGISSQKIFFLT
jgi:serine/threonine-protein kinase Chk1